MRGSWMDEKRTIREYQMSNGQVWIVDNQYQTVPCRAPDCEAVQYCRSTHIYRQTDQGFQLPEHHNNYRSDLEEFKKVQIAYIEGVAVREEETDSGWILIMGKDVIGRAKA